MGNFNTDGKAIFMIFIGVIITITLLAVIADSTFGVTNIITKTNITVTAAAVNVTLDIPGRELISTIEIYNSSNTTQTLIGQGGSLQTGVGSDGLLSVQLLLNDSAASFAGEDLNLSYTANPNGYISDGGGRSVTNLIIVFAALAILIFIIVVLIKFGSLGELIKKG